MEDVGAVLVFPPPASYADKEGATCSRKYSQKDRNGIPSFRTAMSSATVSASVEECETTDWRRQKEESGAHVWRPANTMNAPEVDRLVVMSPARSASLYKSSVRSSALSPTNVSLTLLGVGIHITDKVVQLLIACSTPFGDVARKRTNRKKKIYSANACSIENLHDNTGSAGD